MTDNMLNADVANVGGEGTTFPPFTFPPFTITPLARNRLTLALAEAGAIGLAAQVCFATFPLLNVVVRRRLNLSGHMPL